MLGYIISRNFFVRSFLCYKLKQLAGANFLRSCKKRVRGRTVQTIRGNIYFLLQYVAEGYKYF
jgi:hypothetical protein